MHGEMWGQPSFYWSTGAPVGIPVLARAVPTVDDILHALRAAHEDLALQCATASLGHYIPTMRRLKGFEELHKENYEASYHLTTAIGAAGRILAGSREPGYFALLVTCQREAFRHQRKAWEAWQRLRAQAPDELDPLMERIGGQIRAATGQIQRGMGLSMAALGPDTIARLMEWSESVQSD